MVVIVPDPPGSADTSGLPYLRRSRSRLQDLARIYVQSVRYSPTNALFQHTTGTASIVLSSF